MATKLSLVGFNNLESKEELGNLPTRKFRAQDVASAKAKYLNHVGINLAYYNSIARFLVVTQIEPTKRQFDRK